MDNIEKIRKAIEMRKGYISVTHFAEELLSFLDTLEKEPEVDLEKEIKSWILNECGPSDFSPFADHWCADDIMATARHFAEWGADHLRDSTKKVEQKPAEWSEEDKHSLNSVINLVHATTDGAWGSVIGVQIENWLKNLPERFNPQPKQEWSEDYREEDIQTRFAFYTYKDEDGVLYLSNVFVEETSRNHGFGTKILIAAEKVAETIGATTISLKVKQDSPANAWYRKNGYGYVAFEDGYDWLEKKPRIHEANQISRVERGG